MTPITKNIIVVDEFGNEYTSTYAKRAKGLVKNGRARWLDGNTICFVCPPDENLEDNEMENRAENMEPINVVCESEEPKTEQVAITTADILSRIDQIIEQGFVMQHAVMQIKELPVNECPDGGVDGAARADAIRNIYIARETTNQRLIDFLNQMYNDIAPKQVSGDAKVIIAETISKMDFAGVPSETANTILNFISNSLM